MKKCEEYELAISCYVDGEVEPDMTVPLFHHLAECERCSFFMSRIIQIRVHAAREEKSQAPERIVSLAPFGKKMRASVVAHRFLHGRLVLPVPVAAVLTTLLIVSILISSLLWSQVNTQQENQKIQTVYIATLPGVHVQASYPPAKEAAQ